MGKERNKGTHTTVLGSGKGQKNRGVHITVLGTREREEILEHTSLCLEVGKGKK